MSYTYELHKTKKPLNSSYTLDELQDLTTLQLREICQKEKIVIGMAYKLDRPYIINTILKYRGTKLSTFVNTYKSEQYKNVLTKFRSYLNFIDTSKSVKTPTRITLYKNLDTKVNDNYIISSSILSQGNALLLNEKNEICGILNIKKVGEEFFIICNHELLKEDLPEGSHKNYSLGFLEESSSKYLYNFYYETSKVMPTKLNCYIKPISQLEILTAKPTNTSLVIDFGTSNSAVGVYLDEFDVDPKVRADLQKNGILVNEIDKVNFINTSTKNSEETEILPTVVSIKDCSDESNITYRFGYDALKTARKNNYNNPASVFYSIKKWVNNYTKQEEIFDEDGNMAIISRKEILRAYFKYLISISEQEHKCQYKTLHITSPIKQKQQFLDMYQDILEDYDVIVNTALDEGISVLYNSISNQIEKKNFEDGLMYKALIIDCGGGTTDLTSCDYFIEDNQITYKLNLTTTYANGETNFGGNNITYRIFQYLKIVFSKHYKKEKIIPIEDLFDAELLDIYRYVDSKGLKKTYEKLETLYRECEEFIPTKFYEFRNSPSEDYMKVKSNFYFLWNLAERIKVDFFQNVGINQTSFHESGLKRDLNDNKILPEESWRINVFEIRKNHSLYKNITKELNTLVLKTELPNFIISKEEIVMLIKADIYYIIKNFIEPIYLTDEINDFNFIKLTGQTCKIDIFRDALKEFIPGRVIESSKKDKSVQDFKLTCLEGAIKYQNAQKIGTIAPYILNNAPIIPYKLIAHTHAGVEVILISHLKEITQSYGFISRNIYTESVELILKDVDDKVLHKYNLRTSIKEFRISDYNETSKDYSEKILQDDIDNILNDEIKIFTFAFEDKWGFYVLPIARQDGKLLMGKRTYFPFENDEWEVNFFDGRK